MGGEAGAGDAEDGREDAGQSGPRATTIATARGGPEAVTRSAVTTAEAAALASTRRPPVRDERPRPSHARVSMSAAQ